MLAPLLAQKRHRPRVSDAATVALIALFFATGTYNGWRGVAAPANIVGSWYGQVLIFKLVLVLVAAALGGHNRFFEMPSLLASLRDSSANHARHLKRFSTVLHVESWVLIGVVAIAAVLVSSLLPGTESHSPRPIHAESHFLPELSPLRQAEYSAPGVVVR